MTISAPGSSVSRHAWLVVALLVPVALLNYLDRQMLASMKFSVMRDIPDIALEANWGNILAHVQVGLRRPQPDRRLPRRSLFSRRHVIAGSLFVWSLVTWATGHVDQLRGAARDARADGHQRGVLHPGGAGADRRRPPRRHALARRRLPPDGDLLRRHRRRLRRLRRRSSRPRLALGLRRLRRRSASLYALPLFLLLRERSGSRPRRRRRVDTVAADRRAGPRRARAARQRLVPPARRSTSRCRRSPAGSSATGCRRS